ncbi:MAG TPA: hypothetical protein EYQ85_04110 [Candidatus Poseidoniales archaeon]|jgi:hypothetical protein|nr:MAG: hypothetical protein CXT68_07570 [Euryarchaeota archaeon]HIF16421.1 hypothetical protein [Candidatus Poseidoniales archaeon]
MPFEEYLHPVLARHFPPDMVNELKQHNCPSDGADRIYYAFRGLIDSGELSDLAELIDSSMEKNRRIYADQYCGCTLHQILTGAENADFVWEEVDSAFRRVIQRHNSKQQSVPPPPGFNLDESHWQKIEQLAISNLRSNDCYRWLRIIAEIPGPREKCVNAINAIMSLDTECFAESNMGHLCKAIINHCGSNACALLEELLRTHDFGYGGEHCAKALAEIGYWRHITFLQEEVGADELAEKLRFRLIANGSSYIESIHNIEFSEEEINREIMALQNEELRAEKMQQTSLQAQLTGHIRALSSRVDSLEKKGEESSPQTVVNVMNVDVRDSVVMGNIEQSTIKDSMFDLDDLDL